MFSKPYLALDDTDNDKITYIAYAPFATTILTPISFPLRSPRKQVRFQGNFELAYLHPKRFTPNPIIIQKLGLQVGEPYTIVRFVGHSAVHDIFEKGLTVGQKERVVQELSGYGRVFISSETQLPETLEGYRFPLEPWEMHHAMAFALLVFGESATMSSEAAVLGVPSVFLDSKGRCYTQEEEEKYGLVFRYNLTPNGIENGIRKGVELLTTAGVKEDWREKRRLLIEDSIDVTEFLVWFIENYPQNIKIIKEDPDYQLTFK